MAAYRQQTDECEARLSTPPAEASLPSRNELLHLARDLESAWNAPATSM